MDNGGMKTLAQESYKYVGGNIDAKFDSAKYAAALRRNNFDIGRQTVCEF